MDGIAEADMVRFDLARFVADNWWIWLIAAVVTADYAMYFNQRMGSSMLGDSGGITLLQAVASIPLALVRGLHLGIEKIHDLFITLRPHTAFTTPAVVPVTASLLAAAGIYLKFFAG